MYLLSIPILYESGQQARGYGEHAFHREMYYALK